MLWFVKYERGDYFIVAAETASQAVAKVVEEEPTFAGADLLEVNEWGDVFRLLASIIQLVGCLPVCLISEICWFESS